MISIKGLCKAFGDNLVLKGIDLEVADKEVVVIIGPSGSGKSTLLRSINYRPRERFPSMARSFRPPTSIAFAPRSAWCSSASTSFRT